MGVWHVSGEEGQGPTISIVFHSLLRILLTSPVRIIWFAAEICGRRFRAKIMNAFIGRLGVPSALRVWEVSAWYGSSGVMRAGERGAGEGEGERGSRGAPEAGRSSALLSG